MKQKQIEVRIGKGRVFLVFFCAALLFYSVQFTNDLLRPMEGDAKFIIELSILFNSLAPFIVALGLELFVVCKYALKIAVQVKRQSGNRYGLTVTMEGALRMAAFLVANACAALLHGLTLLTARPRNKTPEPTARIDTIVILLQGTHTAVFSRLGFPHALKTIDDSLRSLENVLVHHYNWSTYNSFRSRAKEATDLSEYIKIIRSSGFTRRIVLIGHSHGGSLALHCATLRPANENTHVIALAAPMMYLNASSVSIGKNRIQALSDLFLPALFVAIAILAFSELIKLLLAPVYPVFVSSMLALPIIAFAISALGLFTFMQGSSKSAGKFRSTIGPPTRANMRRLLNGAPKRIHVWHSTARRPDLNSKRARSNDSIMRLLRLYLAAARRAKFGRPFSRLVDEHIGSLNAGARTFLSDRWSFLYCMGLAVVFIPLIPWASVVTTFLIWLGIQFFGKGAYLSELEWVWITLSVTLALWAPLVIRMRLPFVKGHLLEILFSFGGIPRSVLLTFGARLAGASILEVSLHRDLLRILPRGFTTRYFHIGGYNPHSAIKSNNDVIRSIHQYCKNLGSC